MKWQKGVSMMELVIVIIIIILIATFSVYTGRTVLEQATATEVFEEMNVIIQSINDINLRLSFTGGEFEPERGVHYDEKVSDIFSNKNSYEAMYGATLTDEEFNQMYIIYGMDIIDSYQNSNVRTYYALDNIKHSYLVNFETAKVDLLRPAKISDRTVRTYEQVRALVDNRKFIIQLG